jgi:hypothetical protein
MRSIERNGAGYIFEFKRIRPPIILSGPPLFEMALSTQPFWLGITGTIISDIYHRRSITVHHKNIIFAISVGVKQDSSTIW